MGAGGLRAARGGVGGVRVGYSYYVTICGTVSALAQGGNSESSDFFQPHHKHTQHGVARIDINAQRPTLEVPSNKDQGKPRMANNRPCTLIDRLALCFQRATLCENQCGTRR
eukprot:scaffold242579_cov40-Tisochrysis_lutea.AAC.3